MDICADPACARGTAHAPVGRTPVTVTVDGHTWRTSVWRDTKSNRSLLPVPKKYLGTRRAGDVVSVTLELDPLDLDDA